MTTALDAAVLQLTAILDWECVNRAEIFDISNRNASDRNAPIVTNAMIRFETLIGLRFMFLAPLSFILHRLVLRDWEFVRLGTKLNA